MSEIVNDLIKNIAIPLPDMERRYASREILFPAHLIGLCIAQMWSFKLSEQLKKLLFNVAQSIQLMTAVSYD
jgi:myosin-5